MKIQPLLFFSIFFLYSFSYSAQSNDQNTGSLSITQRLDTFARKVVRPHAICTQPPSSKDYFKNPIDPIEYAFAKIAIPIFNTRFPYWLSDTQTKRAERTTALLKNYNSIAKLGEFKEEAISYNIDANCFNYVGNLTTIIPVVMLHFPISKAVKLLALTPTIFFKYKAYKQTPLYDMKAIETKITTIESEKPVID